MDSIPNEILTNNTAINNTGAFDRDLSVSQVRRADLVGRLVGERQISRQR
jgi:hypothetical protein